MKKQEVNIKAAGQRSAKPTSVCAGTYELGLTDKKEQQRLNKTFCRSRLIRLSRKL